MNTYDKIGLNVKKGRHNVSVFVTSDALLHVFHVVHDDMLKDIEITEYVQEILNHSVVEFYPGDDYTQYEPRGHYEGDPTLEKYFRCMKWLSRHIFRIEDKHFPEDSHIEMIQAVMISEALRESPDDTQLWEKVYNDSRWRSLLKIIQQRTGRRMFTVIGSIH